MLLFFCYYFILFLYICGSINYSLKTRTLNYKELFHRVVVLLSSPAKAWEEISNRKEERLVLPCFVYPMIGLCGLSEFIGAFIGRDFLPEVFQLALTRCCGVAVSLFIGFFLASYVMKLVNERWFDCNKSDEEIQVFVGYSLVVTFVLQIISGLFSILIIHWILQIYTLFVVFEGARKIMQIPEVKLTKYSIIATLVILLSPTLIDFIFNKLSVTLN